MQFFNNEAPNLENQSSRACSCTSNEGLFISNRQLSWVVSGIILFSFFIFMSGYFLGQKKVLEQFSGKLEQDSLADKIYSSLYAMYDQDMPDEENDQADGAEEGTDAGVKMADAAPTQAPDVAAQEKTSATPAQNAKPKQSYYAQLAGFGSATPAYAFAEKLNKKSKVAVVKKNESKSAKGRVHYWYQVVTKPFDSQESLLEVVNNIKQREHLKDVRVLPC